MMSRAVLVSPGPVDVPPEIWLDLPPVHHRSKVFARVMSESDAMIREALGTKHPVRFLAASGTGAMEAAVANVVPRGERLFVLSCGKFGDRWAEIGAAFGCEVSLMRVPDGDAVDLDAVIGRIGRERPPYVAVTHVESSTGSLLRLEELMKRLGAERPVVIVDAVSSFGAEELSMDGWGIDVVVGASQKAIGAPAGVSFVCMRDGLRPPAARRELYYFDLARYVSEEGRSAAPFTPAAGTMQLVHRSLTGMRGVGFARVRERHRRAGEAFISACEALGLFVFPQEPSAAVQVLKVPRGVRSEDILSSLDRRGFIAANGQGMLRGSVVRTGFLGLFDSSTVVRLVRALGEAASERGVSCDIEAAERRIAKYEEPQPLFMH